MTSPIIILGGGLWGGLLAYRLNIINPEIDFILFEKGSTFGGNHTWSFHGSDLSDQDFEWIKPFISKSWNGYMVSFPRYQREFTTAYHAISSAHFHQVLCSELTEKKMMLKTDSTLENALTLGNTVFDARGIFQAGEVGYQKFLGLDLKLKQPHKLPHPIIMDARVSQKDGFRFIYYLPWSEDSIMVEDTRYSHSAKFNEAQIEHDLMGEVEKAGWEVQDVVRRETGVLPIPLSVVPNLKKTGVIDLSGIFHDTTGYSLPYAVKIISRLMKLPKLDLKHFNNCISEVREEIEGNRKFFRMLNSLLFKAAHPDERYKMLEFFYRHRPELISRFYSAEMTGLDKIKFFMGRPPVSISAAIRTLVDRSSS
jgi:lycopene beta-cyclase